jgi:hypothetical protein
VFVCVWSMKIVETLWYFLDYLGCDLHVDQLPRMSWLSDDTETFIDWAKDDYDRHCFANLLPFWLFLGNVAVLFIHLQLESLSLIWITKLRYQESKKEAKSKLCTSCFDNLCQTKVKIM